MRKVCAAFQVILISSWALTESPPLVAQPSSTEAFGHQGGGALTESPPLVAQPSSTEAFGHQGAGVDHSDNRGTKEDDQFSATKQGNPSKGIASHLDEETEAFVLTPNLISLHSNLEASTKISDSLNNNLRRKRQEQNNCEMYNPGTLITFESQSTTLHVRAKMPFTLDIKVDVTLGFDKTFIIDSESYLGISRDIEWNAITIVVSWYWKYLIYDWKLEVKHGDRVWHDSWLLQAGSVFNSMTITVKDCIKWYSGVIRPMCQSPTTVTASSRPTTSTAQSRTTPGTTPTTPGTTPPTPGTTPPTVSSESGPPTGPEAPTSNPSSPEEQGRGTDDPGTVSEQSVHPLYWLLVLPLVAVVAAAIALGWLLKRMQDERKAAAAPAIEAVDQPRVRNENIGPVHDWNDVKFHPACVTNNVKLNPACGTGTWRCPSLDGYLIPIPSVSQMENIYDDVDNYHQ